MTSEQFKDGATILKAWLGDGAVPVSPELAQARANICRFGFNGKPCPHNCLGEWKFSDCAAETIRTWSEFKNRCALAVDGEPELGTCDVCSCALRLKVHVPFRHIYDYTSDQTFSKFPPYCWLAIELTKHTTQ